jgi:type IV pilus assembly protein PilQ
MKITRTLKASLAAMCLFAFGDASARALVGLDYSVMTGNTVQVVFTFDEPAVAPRTFTIDEPARIALDFGDTENKLEQRNMQVGIGAMQSIISAASQNRTRVVLNLSQKANYTTNVSGNQVILTLAGSDQTLARPRPRRPAPAPPARQSFRRWPKALPTLTSSVALTARAELLSI